MIYLSTYLQVLVLFYKETDSHKLLKLYSEFLSQRICIYLCNFYVCHIKKIVNIILIKSN